MINQAGKFLTGAWLLLSLLAALPQGLEASIAEDKPLWLDVDTTELKLTVMQDAKPVKVFENIAIGSNGVTRDKRNLDEKTPLGDFHIMEIRRSARFNLFMAIDYPNLDHTQRAYADKRIDPLEYEVLLDALRHGAPPPQNTSLGGHLGIHGLGAGDARVHASYNWTKGCIALTNDQLEELVAYVRVGTAVKIR